MNKPKTVAFVALSAAFLGLFSQIILPVPSGVPITLQSFAVTFTVTLLSWKKGVAAVGIWLLLGAVGIPVFAGFQGGPAVFAGPTGGFLTGFLFLAFFCGQKEKNALWKDFSCALPGLLLCHIAGTVWFSFVTNVPLRTAALSASFPYLIKDLPLVFAALWCAAYIKKHLSLFRE